ncbi:4Fe-4S binding protein [Brevibacterium yomogidense]|uniref:4Fe-4S binding protein n=1 Tax=Brevibacterium yomogidense TaxID=946573 RepID=UPI000B34EE07|nr:4Fe-4S binding protein [Brevibacterium yomogidense]
MSIFEHKGDRKNLRLLTEVPQRVVKECASAPAKWIFPNGPDCVSSCIACADEPCRKIGESEQSVPGIDALAGDLSSVLCPVNAIGWDATLETPKIDPDTCIGCGLCVARCPVGAISVLEGIATVATDQSQESTPRTKTMPLSAGQLEQQDQIAELPTLESAEPIAKDIGVVGVTEVLENSSEAVQKAAVRSLLVAAGGSVSLSRKGDVHTRMDGTYATKGGALGSLEVEFGFDSLEALRASLDDVAVLESRYGIPIADQVPLVVCGGLPRERQGYWQVVLDIDRVLELKIRTATAGAMLLLVWNRKPFTAQVLDQLTPHFGSTSIRSQIEAALGRPVDIPRGLGGILEPEK